MDYLVEKNFSILISLDGNEVQSAYRVDKMEFVFLTCSQKRKETARNLSGLF